MTGHAVILIAAAGDEGLPPLLFARVGGLSLVERLIQGCWRAGVSRVTILAPPRGREELEGHLAGLNGRGEPPRVVTDWPSLWDRPQDDRDDQSDGPTLVLLANILATAWVIEELAQLPLRAGHLALAVAAGSRAAGGESPSAHGVALNGNLVTALHSPRQDGDHAAVGLVSMSPAAWQGWRDWRQGQGADAAAVAPEAQLLGYLAGQARERQVVAVIHDPRAVSVINRTEDLAPASVRLVAAIEGSPWSEGWLENTLNRRLARKILLHIADRRVTPNLLTVSDLAVGLVAVAAFAVGTYWSGLAGALLLSVVILLDCMDGLLARLTFQETWRGLVLDLYGDTILNFLVFAGIALGQFRATGRPLFLVLLLPLAAGYFSCWQLTNPLKKLGAQKPVRNPPLRKTVPLTIKDKLVDEATSRDFFYLILLCALAGRLDWFILATAVGTAVVGLLFPWFRRRG